MSGAADPAPRGPPFADGGDSNGDGDGDGDGGAGGGEARWASWAAVLADEGVTHVEAPAFFNYNRETREFDPVVGVRRAILRKRAFQERYGRFVRQLDGLGYWRRADTYFVPALHHPGVLVWDGYDLMRICFQLTHDWAAELDA